MNDYSILKKIGATQHELMVILANVMDEAGIGLPLLEWLNTIPGRGAFGEAVDLLIQKYLADQPILPIGATTISGYFVLPFKFTLSRDEIQADHSFREYFWNDQVVIGNRRPIFHSRLQKLATSQEIIDYYTDQAIIETTLEDLCTVIYDWLTTGFRSANAHLFYIRNSVGVLVEVQIGFGEEKIILRAKPIDSVNAHCPGQIIYSSRIVPSLRDYYQKKLATPSN